jgi:hypothetical protein|tara:strand:+ start:588 stop:848 length:261 start_codon:yes stop_codon:yes gene_type:complete
MSDKPPAEKTRAALKNLEPWADDEISRLEKTFAAQRHSDDMAATSSRFSGSLLGSVFGACREASFGAGFVLGLIFGLVLSALIILL